MQARTLVLGAPGMPFARIAADAGRCRKRLSRLARSSWLAPDAVRAIVQGTPALQRRPSQLLDTDLPIGRREQMAPLGLA